MKNLRKMAVLLFSLAGVSSGAVVQMTISGVYQSDASSGLADQSWVAQYTYDTLAASTDKYSSAISAASFTVGDNHYVGLPGPFNWSDSSLAGTIAFASPSRIEFRSTLYLDGDSAGPSIEVYEFVFEDETAFVGSPTLLPESFDLNDVNKKLMVTNFPGGSLDNGTIQSVTFETIPEPSSWLLLTICSGGLFLRRRLQ